VEPIYPIVNQEGASARLETATLRYRGGFPAISKLDSRYMGGAANPWLAHGLRAVIRLVILVMSDCGGRKQQNCALSMMEKATSA
jgi:hypothetical protein